MILKLLNISDNDLFKEWFEWYESADNIEEYIYFSDSTELRELNDDLDQNIISKEKYDKEYEEIFKEFCLNWFEDALSTFDNNFEDKAIVQSDHIILSRAITVPSISSFIDKIKNGNYIKGYTGLGVFWSWDHDKAEAHWGNAGIEIEIIAKFHLRNIDLKTSVLKNLCPSLGEDEAEIQVLEGSELELIDIKRNGISIYNTERQLDLVA
jgi:hypothetical protein